MRRPKHQAAREEDLFVGIDLHKRRWHLTIRTFDIELFSAASQGTGNICSVSWLDMIAINCRRSMKPVI
jgi:hypothetical protein